MREQEFLKRIEALEAKVVDRDGLLAKVTRQQARLDRLENLARENELLKAQMKGEGRRVVQTSSKEASGKPMRAKGSATPQPPPAGEHSQVQPLSTRRTSLASQPEVEVQTTEAMPTMPISAAPASPVPRKAPAVRRLVSSPALDGSGVALQASGPVQARSELESRLEELEAALGLQPAAGEPVPARGACR